MPPPRWAFLLHKLPRTVMVAMRYLLVTVLVCGLLSWWYAHPSLPGQSPTRAHRTPSDRTTDPVPVGATTRCSDGTYSFSEHRASACTHHGGVAIWLND